MGLLTESSVHALELLNGSSYSGRPWTVRWLTVGACLRLGHYDPRGWIIRTKDEKLLKFEGELKHLGRIKLWNLRCILVRNIQLSFKFCSLEAKVYCVEKTLQNTAVCILNQFNKTLCNMFSFLEFWIIIHFLPVTDSWVSCSLELPNKPMDKTRFLKWTQITWSTLGSLMSECCRIK